MAKSFGKNIDPCNRRAVAWYSPQVLLEAARELFSSLDFQRNFDRRESFTDNFTAIDLTRTEQPNGEFWFDFIADTGDSGNATYAVARAALTEQLTALDRAGQATQTLRTGQLLLLGGDLAYPGASPEEYQYRFIEPFEMARQSLGVDCRAKNIAAIPQNHDWFDNVSTFFRYFVNRDKGDFIGARTPQKRTYFALKLPHDWWVLGFDFALAGDIDRTQFEAFAELCTSEQINASSKLILIYPEPYWYRDLGDGAADGYPKRYQRLEHLLQQASTRIAMRLAGDQHHYVHETVTATPLVAPSATYAARSHLVTCGTGGAFMHPTHCRDAAANKIIDQRSDLGAIDDELQARIRVGRSDEIPQDFRFSSEKVSYPPVGRSRAFAWRTVFSMFKPNFCYPRPRTGSAEWWVQILDSNIGFAIFLGVLYGFNAYVNALAFSYSFKPDGFGPMAEFCFRHGMLKWLHAMIFAPSALLINLAMLGACIRMAWEPPASPLVRIISGTVHGLIHGFCVFALYWLATHWFATIAEDSPFAAALLTWLAVTIGGGLVGGLLFGAYFALCILLGHMPNNTFGALAIHDFKGFLRFRLTADSLQAYFIGLDKVNERTTLKPAPGAAADRWQIKDEFSV